VSETISPDSSPKNPVAPAASETPAAAGCPFHFSPPYPRPHKDKSSFLLRFLRGWRSWLDVLFEKSYRMKMGHFRQPGLDVYMVNEPRWVRHVLVEDAENFPKHPLMHRMLEPLLGQSIFTTNGPVWERQRRLVDQAFEQARLQTVFPLMRAAVDDMIGRLDPVADGRSYEVDGETTWIAADIIFRTILSQKIQQSDAQEIFHAFMKFQSQAQRAMILSIYHLPAFLPRWASQRSAKRIRAVLAEFIQRRYQARERGEKDLPRDILGALIEAKDPVHGDSFTYPEMVDQICMLFLAGHETSASALAWALYLISRTPDLQERMREEIEREIGDRPFEFGDTMKLRFVTDVFREVLRLYPPVGFFIRSASRSERIRDKDVASGSAVLISPWLIHRHRELWERPDEFDPDRFRSPSGKESLKCAYMPFSSGPRVCVGAGFALQEAVLVLASLVRRYRVEPDLDHEPQPVGRVTIRSDNGIRIRLHRRHAAPAEAP
jgi:cytochrome P450